MAKKLIKVDSETRTAKTWCEENVFPSEPIFIPSPDPQVAAGMTLLLGKEVQNQSEDDGVVLSSLIWGQGTEKQVGLLVLDASSWTEISRTVFQTPSAVPGSLHGWFTPSF